ncbi:Methionine synthase [Symbiodinium microadriaticum]|uniref:Methionine synthase n=1 Tax=Symbiodinium microadriaticum TaxID=2951 RepID=A0A1Q9CF90_SYMMI|nr:Methionine synthase [Symbiodinium microadriaticum]
MSWEVIAEGLKSTQGMCIVNGISMASSEEDFVRVAAECRRFGAAMLVLAMSRVASKLSCQRAYHLLRSEPELDFPPEDIIFDCLITLLGAFEAVMCSLASTSRPRRAGTRRAAQRRMLQMQAMNQALLLAASAGREGVTRRGEGLRNTLQPKLREKSALVDGEAACFAEPGRPSPLFTHPVEILVQAAGPVSASVFQTFGSKAHAPANFHRLSTATTINKTVHFSSISEASMIQYSTTTVPWGVIGEIGLRKVSSSEEEIEACEGEYLYIDVARASNEINEGRKTESNVMTRKRAHEENWEIEIRADVTGLPNDPTGKAGKAFLEARKDKKHSAMVIGHKSNGGSLFRFG